MSNGPLVSVIIPCYNYGSYVEEAIRSVQRSTYPHVELIVVDDGSTDPHTLETLERIAREESILVLRQPNGGLSNARNTGVAHAKGEYIVPLDADDLLEETFLAKALWHLERKPQLGIAYSWVRLFGTEDKLWITEEFCLTMLLHHNYMPATAMYRRELWAAAGGYDETMRDGYEDWEFWIRAAAQGWQGECLKEPLFLYRKHGHSMIDDSRGKHEQLVRHIRQKHRDLYGVNWRIDLYRRYLIRKTLQRVGPIWRRIKAAMPPGAIRSLRRLYRRLRPVPVTSYSASPMQESSSILAGFGSTDERIGVLVVLPWLEVGGVERVTLDILAGIDRNEFSIILMTTLTGDHPWEERFRPYADRIVHLSGAANTEQEQVDFFLDFVRSNRIECIHVAHSQFGYRVAKAVKNALPHVRIFDTIHVEEPYEAWDYLRFARPFQQALDWRVTITPSLRERLLQSFGESPERIHVIENGIQLDAYDPDRYRRDQPGKIAFVGRFAEQKQPLRFVEIAAALLRKDPSLRFLMVGDGPLRRQVEREISRLQCSEQFELMGWSSDVAALFAERVSLLVAPSLHEGLPITGLEAMAMGVPVVASDVPGWRDLIDSGRDGVLVCGQDAEPYVQPILELVQNNELARRMAEQALGKVHAKYGALRMSSQYQLLYRGSAAIEPRMEVEAN